MPLLPGLPRAGRAASPAAFRKRRKNGSQKRDPQVDPGQSEVLWACYAWPASFGNSGKRTFFINQSGDVLQAQNQATRYSGPSAVPASTAVMLSAATLKTSMNHSIAVNSLGADGQFWTVTN